MVAAFLPAPGAGAEEPKRVIRTITVEVRDVFDVPNPNFFYQTANQLKVNTKESVIRRELLVAEGDEYDAFRVQESERNLRALPFFHRGFIETKFDGSAVDLNVVVQDTWTLIPVINLTLGSGRDKKSAGIIEGNVLGYGKRLELLAEQNEDRESIEGIFDNRRIFGTLNNWLIGHFERTDGRRTVSNLGRPFRSLVDPYSWSLNVDQSNLVGRLFENGEESFIYRAKRQIVSGSYTVARGDPQSVLNRFSAGAEYSREIFSQASLDDFDDIDVDPSEVEQDPRNLADNRTFVGPTLGYRQVRQDFISLAYVDRSNRQEDFNLGNDFGARVQLASKALGSTYDTGIVSLSDAIGKRLGESAFLRSETGLTSRVLPNEVENTLLRGELKFFNVVTPRPTNDWWFSRQTVAAQLAVDAGFDLDRDRQFTLGASSLLRGYKDRAFTGNRMITFNAEDRIHLADDIFQLANLGVAAFFDAGTAGDGSLGRLIADELRSDVGFGLRIGLPRSSSGNVLRIDLAFPLRNGPDGTNEWEPRLLVSFGQAFTARTRTERVGLQQANLSIGLPD